MLKKITSLMLVVIMGGGHVAQAATSKTQSTTPSNSSTSSTHIAPQPLPPEHSNPVRERESKEKKAETNPYAIVFYKPSYVLPYYFTGSPYNSIYKNNTPSDESIKSSEIKYQFSFKVPAWKNILNSSTSLYLAYTQLSYWQAYNKQAFFRETDYEPEIYFSDEINYPLFKNWRLNSINIGAVHQSNGQGNALERSWNRAYLGAMVSSDNWFIGVKPWIIFRDSTYERQNPDMNKYMGYEEILVGYKYNNQVFSLETRNLIESSGRRSGNTLSWSFPITIYIKGYVQAFSGYGQSLIEYNHRTNSIGVGIALSNWV